MLDFTLETVRTIHFFGLVVSSVDKHIFGIQPCDAPLVLVSLSEVEANPTLTLEGKGDQDDLDRPRTTIDQVTVHEQTMFLIRFARERQ